MSTVIYLPTFRTTDDDAVTGILGKAVAAYRAAKARGLRNAAARRHLAAAHNYLDAAAVAAGRPDSVMDLYRSLDSGITDPAVLARVATEYEGPAIA